MRETKKEALINFHRENIVHTAEILFENKGIEKTTMDDIAKDAQYSKATLYVYFKNKDEIVDSIVLKSMRQLRDKIHESIEDSTDWINAYNSVCKTMVVFFEEDKMAFESAVGEINIDIDSDNTTQVAKDIFAASEEINAELTAFLIDGITRGYLKEDLPIIQTMFLLLASITGIVKMAQQKQAYMEKYLELSKETFLQDSFKMLLGSILK